MKFKKNAKPIYTNDLWYDLFDGGYIKPSELLADKDDIEKVEQAIKLIKKFTDEACAANLILDY
ncbi:hypothetical protein [Avibacterium paragallinarum]|uniref:Uncharacterized protein n=1 Tax=Avibacterium paragallinarum TaxID=728 RepID=A0AAE5TFW0_AVIPA|nr:hypothetical protein [Avibacterium paragallinarum]MEE3609390.1 hypothetical protein [Avibacterium paragallinarum]MEE3622204.1 hypothetical protein [Avibacterium paragallinarum]MEE3669958.1 hypothetical protein [Avibacterium paragallinarum]MEE3682066.1 hypothetical protein [Avibacterium paragallinarum]MEE4386647.1 hypothetical protein [Avibacterium paragallinarum]